MQQSSQALGHHPPLAWEFVRGAERLQPGCSLQNSSLWGSGCTPKDSCGFLGLRDASDTWNVQQHGCYGLNRELAGTGSTDQSAHLLVYIHLVEAHSLDAHKVRSEETTIRRRERRKDTNLKRAAKVQSEGHSSAVERELSSVRRWYLLGNLISTEAVPVDRETHPNWHHLVVRACCNVSSCAELWGLSGFLTCSSVPSVRRENKRSLRHPCWSDAFVRRSSTGHVHTWPRRRLETRCAVDTTFVLWC